MEEDACNVFPDPFKIIRERRLNSIINKAIEEHNEEIKEKIFKEKSKNGKLKITGSDLDILDFPADLLDVKVNMVQARELDNLSTAELIRVLEHIE